jgi:hypothetical protein
MHMAERNAQSTTKCMNSVAQIDKHITKRHPVSNYAGLRDLEGVELTLLKIKADLMCELVSVCHYLPFRDLSL